MLILLNHAGNLESISDMNYDLDKNDINNDLNILETNSNSKDSVC